jgi:hypothetical protein
MRRALIVVVLAMTTLVGAQAAFAAIARDVSIRYDATTERFHGRITSSDTDCESGRVVKVYKKTASGPVLQGKATSKASGRWALEVMHAHGKYFAATPTYKGMHGTCDHARSVIVDVM